MIVIVLCLALFLTTGNSRILSAKEYKLQIVCQAWDEENQRFLGRVLILEQLSAIPFGSSESQAGTIDASALVATAHQPPSTENAAFRLRIYNNVSLISHLPSLSGRAAGSIARSDNEKRELAEISFSMGTRDGDIITSLRNRMASVNAWGRKMDYSGYGRRVGSRLTFRSTLSNHSEKSLNLFLRVRGQLSIQSLGRRILPRTDLTIAKSPYWSWSQARTWSWSQARTWS